MEYLFAAHDARTGKQVWSKSLRIDDDLDGLDLASSKFRIVDVDRGHLVFLHDNVSPGETESIVLDPASGALRWRERHLYPLALAGDVVAGYRVISRNGEIRIVGLDAANGNRRWRGPELGDEPRYPAWDTFVHGTTMSIASVDDAFSQNPITHLLDTATGQVRATWKGEWGCVHDSGETIVCDSGGRLAGFDASSWQNVSGEKLWQLPDAQANREAPGLMAARKGIVYVVGSDGRMTLRARSGKDLDLSIGRFDDSDGDLEQIVPGYALVEQEVYGEGRDVVLAYPAAG